MKNLSCFILMLLSITLLGTSCRKEYNCHCKGGWADVDFPVKKSNLKQAQKKCSAHDQPDMDDGPYDCHITN